MSAMYRSWHLAMMVGRRSTIGRAGVGPVSAIVGPVRASMMGQRSNQMTGLDLESFLLLLRADLTTWMLVGLATIGIALLVWSCWRSRRALRKCLVLSLAAHFGLVLYGSTI